MRWWISGFFALSVVWPVRAQEAPSIGQVAGFYARCVEFPRRTPDPGSSCVLIILGIEQGIRAAQFAAEKPYICIPEGTEIDKTFPMFRNYVFENKDVLVGTTASAVYSMLLQRFPCRPGAERRF